MTQRNTEGLGDLGAVAGAITASAGALSFGDWMAICGILVAAASLIIGSVHRRKIRLLREREIALLEKQIKP